MQASRKKAQAQENAEAKRANRGGRFLQTMHICRFVNQSMSPNRSAYIGIGRVQASFVRPFSGLLCSTLLSSVSHVSGMLHLLCFYLCVSICVFLLVRSYLCPLSPCVMRYVFSYCLELGALFSKSSVELFCSLPQYCLYTTVLMVAAFQAVGSGVVRTSQHFVDDQAHPCMCMEQNLSPPRIHVMLPIATTDSLLSSCSIVFNLAYIENIVWAESFCGDSPVISLHVLCTHWPVRQVCCQVFTLPIACQSEQLVGFDLRYLDVQLFFKAP